MKRSQKINLAFMRKATATTVLLSSSFLLNGCDSGQPAAFYRSIQECQRDNPIYSYSCENAYNKAQLEAAKTAPKYSTLADCEYDFGQGNCVVTSDLHYMPRISGFLLSELSENNYDYDDPEPLYHYRGSYVNGSGLKYGSSTMSKKLSVDSSTFTSKSATTTTTSRGGFGSMVAAKSSSSGSHSSSRGFGG